MDNIHKIAPVFWLLGVAGTGKSTLAEYLFHYIRFTRGIVNTATVDGNYQRSCTDNWDFSPAGRKRNIDGIRAIAKNFSENGVIVVVSAITPYKEMRDQNRQEMQNYHEIFINTDRDIRIARNHRRGLMNMALEGKIQDYTGINGVFDVPANPHLVINNDSSVEDAKEELFRYADTYIQDWLSGKDNSPV